MTTQLNDLDFRTRNQAGASHILELFWCDESKFFACPKMKRTQIKPYIKKADFSIVRCVLCGCNIVGIFWRTG